MKTKLKLIAILLSLPMFALLAFKTQFASAQMQVVTAGQKFKNIKVLNDMPADQMGQVMNIMSASLGVDCKMCHSSNDKDFEKDGNEHKDIARKMLTMTLELNKKYFEGKPEVSCNSCHNGRERPVAMPNLMPVTPVERPKQPAVKPMIDDILAKYAASLGGKDNLTKVKSRHIKANRVERDGITSEPEEIWQFGSSMRIETKYPGYLAAEVFDGKDAWKTVNDVPVELKAYEIEQIRRDARLLANADLKTVYAKLEYRFMDRIDGREVYVVQATTAENQRERLIFDVATGQLVRRIASAMTVIGQFQYQVDYSEYKDFGGVKLPASSRFAVPNISWTRKIVEVKNNVPVEAARFEKP